MIDLPAETVDTLVARADGVPLYVEELFKTVMEPGASSMAAIPATLADLLMARLDRLSTAKEVAQAAAVLGREFPYALLVAVVDMADAALRHEIGLLVEAEIVFARGEPPSATYSFKHALLQETAYESLLQRTRRELHTPRRQALVEQFPAEPRRRRRCSRATAPPPAWCPKRSRPTDRQATRPPHGWLTRRRRATSPRHSSCSPRCLTTPRAERRRSICAWPGQPRSAHCAATTIRSSWRPIERVDELLAAIGTGPQQIPGLLKLAVLHTNKLRRAHAYADALLSCRGATRARSPADGRLHPARHRGDRLRDRSRSLRRPAAGTRDRRNGRVARPQDGVRDRPLAMGCSTYAIALVLAGRPDSAAALVERGVRRARELAHPRTQASALQIGATAFHLADDACRVGELSDQCIEVVDGRGFHHIEVMARVLAAWARARQGDHAATDAMDEALRSAERHGVVAGMPLLCFAAADAHLLAGEHARALEQVARGEQFFERSGERLQIRAASRVDAGARSPGRRAEIPTRCNPCCCAQSRSGSEPSRPGCCCRRRRCSGGVALETGKRRDEARERLARLYAAFDEGFETERLRDAHAMLDRLAR